MITSMKLQLRKLQLRKSAVAVASVAALLAFGATACSTSDILKVDDPDVPGTSSLSGPESLPVLLAGAVGDFRSAFQGTGAGVSPGGSIIATAIMTDELKTADTYPARDEWDQRNIKLTNGINASYFGNIQRARSSADRVAANYAAVDPNNSGRVLMYALSGYATVFLGEDYCSGVPLSSLGPDGATITYGDPLPTSELWAVAIAKFDSAAALATDSLKYVAAIGLGRALLDSGLYDEAAAAVASVPAGFVYNIESSNNTTAQNNGIWAAVNNINWLLVEDRKGTNGLPYRSDNDPRVPWVDPGVIGFDGVTPVYQQLKYPDRSSPVPLATSAEARLIEAEAALNQGQIPTFLAKLNAARAEFPGTTPLTSADIPATKAAQVDLLFKERAYSLWLTGHRLGDMRRLIRQYGRDSETVFPTGTYFRGTAANPVSAVPYGPDVNMPVPQTEQNNPKFHGCIDRNA
jgi:hypothetical protein